MMKLNDCLCRRYSLANETGWEVKEKLIGFEILREPSTSAPGHFGLVEIPRSLLMGRLSNGPKQNSLPPLKPTVLKRSRWSLGSGKAVCVAVNRAGYVYLDEVLVNATTRIVQGLEKVAANTSTGGCSVN